MKGTWILPSRGRPAMLSKFCEAAIKAKTSTPGRVLITPEDLEEYSRITLPEGWILHLTAAHGMGDKFREIWPLVQNLDWVGWTVDDQEPITEHWDTMMISGLTGRNIISCNDEFRAPHRMCTPVFSGDLLRAVGYVYAPGFHHAYMDDAWEQMGTATNSWQVAMNVVVRHADGFKTGVMDATHQHSYSRMAEDEQTYQAWKLSDMDRAVIAILNIPKVKEKGVRYG